MPTAPNPADRDEPSSALPQAPSSAATEPNRRSGRPGAMSNARFALPVVLVLLGAGCAAPAAPPSGSGSASPSPAPTVAGIDHATGRGDVLLRLEQGGGFIGPEWFVMNVPIFSLYGDGTVIFRNDRESPPEPTDGVGRNLQFRTARLSEDQIQALLDSAINEGGLGVARAQYDPGNIMDAGSTIFTIKAGGVEKTVTAVALEMRDQPSPDSAILAALTRLADRLRKLDEGGVYTTETYTPDRYRALLWEPGFVSETPPRAWPWPELKVSDFIAPAGDGPTFPRRVMSPAEAARLGIPNIEGGFQALPMKGPDGKTYLFALRPLLPDEAA